MAGVLVKTPVCDSSGGTEPEMDVGMLRKGDSGGRELIPYGWPLAAVTVIFTGAEVPVRLVKSVALTALSP